MNHNGRAPGALRCLTILATFASILLLAINYVSAGGKNTTPGVLPPHSRPLGHSYSDWSRAYGDWVYSIPAATNPIFDPTGEWAAINQTGPVWFLPVNGLAVPLTREVTIPAGKMIFLVLDAVSWVNAPEYGDNPWSDEQNQYARSILAEWMDNTDLTCTIDGVPVEDIKSYRTRTPYGSEYQVTLPEGNITGVLPAGTYGPALADGYYLFLTPFSKGKHVIRVTGTVPWTDGEYISFETNFNITVE